MRHTDTTNIGQVASNVARFFEAERRKGKGERGKRKTKGLDVSKKYGTPHVKGEFEFYL